MPSGIMASKPAIPVLMRSMEKPPFILAPATAFPSILLSSSLLKNGGIFGKSLSLAHFTRPIRNQKQNHVHKHGKQERNPENGSRLGCIQRHHEFNHLVQRNEQDCNRQQVQHGPEHSREKLFPRVK